MLSTFQVKNFKAFDDTAEIDVKPLTLLSGINSAGKSSIIQSLLLLKQTIGSKHELNLQGKEPLLPEKLSFNQLVYNRPEIDNAQLEYVLKFRYEKDVEKSQRLFELIQQVSERLDILLSQTERYVDLILGITFKHGSYGFLGLTERVTELTFDLRCGDVSLSKIRVSTTQQGSYDVQVQEGSPDRLINEAKLAIDGLTNFLPSSFIFEGETNGWQLSFGEMFRQLMTLVRNDLDDNLYYLGSFRKPAKSNYRYNSSSFVVEKDGGNFASVYYNWANADIERELNYFLDNRFVTKSLAEMTESVLHQVGLKQKVNIRKSEAGVELIVVELDTLNNRDVKVTLPDVGQGYNQILPIIIQGLITPKNGLVIFEQPEIHLHPKVQSQLIEFFIGLARSGRNVLVETHSSHLINWLQLQVVKDYSNWVQDNSQILFIHPPHKYKPSARTEIVEIGRYGSIEFPPNFLPDTSSLYDEIISESFKKHRIERENK